MRVEHFSEDYYTDRSFEHLMLEPGILEGKEFVRCTFLHCNLERMRFQDCMFEDCTFDQCNLGLIKPVDTAFRGVAINSSKVLGVTWTAVKTPFDISFHASNLDSCIFAGLKIASGAMVECSIRDADFTKAHLTRCSFGSSDLRGAQFIQTNLSKCVFPQADLTDARFHDCDLSYTDFSTARNYSINPMGNKLRKTQFSLPEAASLLSAFDIVLK